MSEAREELLARQKACGAVLKDVQESIEEGEGETAVGIAFQLYLTAYAMKRQYWGASFTMADRYCDFAGLPSADIHRSVMSLVEQELGN